MAGGAPPQKKVNETEGYIEGMSTIQYPFNNIKDRSVARVDELRQILSSCSCDKVDLSLVLNNQRNKFTFEKNILIGGVNVRTLTIFRQECVKALLSMVRPHALCLVEVGEHSPQMQGYDKYESPKSHCGGCMIYTRKDMQVIKSETGPEFTNYY